MGSGVRTHPTLGEPRDPLSLVQGNLRRCTSTHPPHPTRFRAIKNRARRTRDKIKGRLQPSFSFIFRFILRSILLVLICAFAPFLLLFALCHDWLMKKFINYAYIYNVSWEDPRMDQEVFNLTEDDHVITIASAGCNVLDYIIEGARVTAVDFNACQIALTELKAVAIQRLEWTQFFAIFAKNDTALLRELYPTVLRPGLSAESAEFWDRYVLKIQSFMYSGTSGFLAFLAFRVVLPLLHLGWIRDAILKRMSKDDFLALCHTHEKQIAICSWLLDTMLPCFALFAGVPRRQMDLGKGRENFSVIVNHVLFNTDLVHDNYFYLGYILGEYTHECCPRYLKQEHFVAMKKHLKAGKLHLFHGSIEQAILKNAAEKDELFTVASLLDHMDWMDKTMVTSEISLLVQRMDQEKGRIYWRSFSENVHIPPLTWLGAQKVDDIYDNTMGDRVGMYFSTWIAYLKDSEFVVTPRCRSWRKDGAAYKNGLGAQLITGAKIITAPVWKRVVRVGNSSSSSSSSTNKTVEAVAVAAAGDKGTSPAGPTNGAHERDMEAFYKFQKEGYDGFRENFLHARADLIQSMPIKRKGGMVWVDVGGGTARNLEFFPVEVLKMYFKAIYVVDVSPSLLEVAQRRVKAAGLSGLVHLVEHDFTAPSIFQALPFLEGKVDMLTFSYSLSMIPDKTAALLHALRFLQPNGHGVLGLADFFLSSNDEATLPFLLGALRKLEATFQRKWFEQDRVHLISPAVLKRVEKASHCVWDERFRGGVPLLPVLRPYHGAYVALTGKSKAQ